MTIYKITKDLQDIVRLSEKLEPGFHTIRFGGLNVPIKVNGDNSVSVNLEGTNGNLEDLDILGFGEEDQVWTVETLKQVRAVTIYPESGETALTLFGDKQELDDFVSVVRTSENPIGRKGVELG